MIYVAGMKPLFIQYSHKSIVNIDYGGNMSRVK